MKPILIASLIAAFASPAIAGRPKPKPAPIAKKPNFGESFELKSRRTAPPRDVDPTVTRSLSHHQAGRVINDRLADVENCWLKLPAGKRVASAATLHVTIEPAGTVSDARVAGELPAGIGKCITAAANRWTFPAADARTEIEHGITLTTR